MKIRPLTRWMAGRRPRTRRARHVLHAKMNGKAQAREFSRRIGLGILVAASLSMVALVTSIGMDVILGTLLYRNADFTLRRFQIEQQGRIGKGELVNAAGVKIGQGILAPPCPPPDIQIEDWCASIALLRSLPLKTLYLTHYGPVSDITAHLDTLEANLLSWSQWMLPHFEKKTPPEEVTPLFQQFVKGELIAAGLDEVGIQQYEAANPSWMSVAGLLRYWTKKQEAG